MKSIVDHRKKYAYFHLYKAHSELYGKTDKMTTNIWTNEFNFKYIKNVCLQNNVLRTKKFQDVINRYFLINLLSSTTLQVLEAALQRCSQEKVFWKYVTNLQKNTHVEVRSQEFSNFIEISLCHGCSPVNLLHVFGTPFPENTSGGLLLKWIIAV